MCLDQLKQEAKKHYYKAGADFPRVPSTACSPSPSLLVMRGLHLTTLLPVLSQDGAARYRCSGPFLLNKRTRRTLLNTLLASCSSSTNNYSIKQYGKYRFTLGQRSWKAETPLGIKSTYRQTVEANRASETLLGSVWESSFEIQFGDIYQIKSITFKRCLHV